MEACIGWVGLIALREFFTLFKLTKFQEWRHSENGPLYLFLAQLVPKSFLIVTSVLSAVVLGDLV